MKTCMSCRGGNRSMRYSPKHVVTIRYTSFWIVSVGSCDHNTDTVANTTTAATYRFRANSENALAAKGNISKIASSVDPQTIMRVGPPSVYVSSAMLPPTALAPFREKREKEP